MSAALPLLPSPPPRRARPARASLAVVLAIAAAIGPGAAAGPSIIRDEMLQDTAITPALGRGYSIATNTYQSMCLIDVVSTTPSYDFDYAFENIQSSVENTGALGSTKTSRGKTTEVTNTQRTRSSDNYQLSNEWTQSRTDTDRGGKSTYQHMLATISINVYYNSVDETKSKLSPAALRIMEAKDIPGFFDACGMYYVRSISRRARIYSLITYTTQTTERDTALESSVKQAIRSFSLTAGQKPPDGTGATTGPQVAVPGGADMIKGQEYTSPNGKFRTVFQHDGNLCVYVGEGMVDCRVTFSKYGATSVVDKDDRCYGLFTRSLNQADAQAACKSYGASLTTISSAAENTLVNGLTNGWAWIGADDLEKEGTFKWASGEKFTYSNWSKGQPDNSGGKEHCVHLWNGGAWNDNECGARTHYICEGEQASQMWCSMTAGQGARASVQANDVIIYNAAGKAIWTTSKDRVGAEGATQLVMQDDGNLVLYSPGKEMIAATGTPKDRMLSGVMIGRPGGDYVTASVTNTTGDRSSEERQSGRMSTKTSGSNLQISTKAIGLGKQVGTMLISYDIETYKRAVESAFKATLPDNVGKVSAIEVVPWMENTEFQSVFRLEERTVPVVDRFGFPEMDNTDPAKPVQKTKKVFPYEQKRILQTNAEFLAEVDRAARTKLNIFYKAKMCRAQIDADYMVMNEKTGEMYFPEDKEVVGYSIEITKASYGANCNPRNVDNMTSILAQACNGTTQCSYPIDIAEIGDPAPGCQKAYEIEFRCMAPAPRGFHEMAIAKEASGKTLNIDCVSPPAKPGAPPPDPAAAPPIAGDRKLIRPTVGQTTYVYNNRKPNESMLLEDVVEMLSTDKLQRLWMEYDSFMYGGTGEDLAEVEKDPAARGAVARAIVLGTRPELGYPKNVFPGAARCIAELFNLGITAVPYRNVRWCQRIEESFATIAGQRIDDYCMPRFTRVPGQASIEEAIDQEAKAGDSTNRDLTAPPVNTSLPAQPVTPATKPGATPSAS